MRAMKLPLEERVLAGPFVFDFLCLATRTVLEVNPDFQYYRGTLQPTALARLRHELIEAMGFRLVHLPARRWAGLVVYSDSKLERLPEALFVVFRLDLKRCKSDY